MELLNVTKDWSHRSSKEFWGKIAPAEHVVQIYENDKVFLDLLYGFVSEGFDAGDCVIVVATPPHLDALAHRLHASGFNLWELKARKKFFPLDAEAILRKFLVDDWPDETLFNQVVADIMLQTTGVNHVRAFGEMVALLWARGLVDATIRLEHLWNKLCARQSFCLFCAYPHSGFTKHTHESLVHVCQAHSKLIAGVSQSQTEVFYTPVESQTG